MIKQGPFLLDSCWVDQDSFLAAGPSRPQISDLLFHNRGYLTSEPLQQVWYTMLWTQTSCSNEHVINCTLEVMHIRHVHCTTYKNLTWWSINSAIFHYLCHIVFNTNWSLLMACIMHTTVRTTWPAQIESALNMHKQLWIYILVHIMLQSPKTDIQ